MSWFLPIFILSILGLGMIRRIPVFPLFCEGVREGLRVCLTILPTLLLMILSVSVFRASGAMELMVRALAPVCNWLSIPSQILPLALVRPLSGGGALSVCEDLLVTYGADSMLGRMAAVLCASTETTFYAFGVYLPGKTGKGMAKLILIALLCDLMTLVATATVVRFFA